MIVSREADRPKGYADVNDPDVMVEIENKVRQINMKVAVKAWLDDLRSKHHVQAKIR